MVSLRVSIKEVYAVVVLPIVASTIFSMSHVNIMMYYLLLIALLTQIDLEGIVKREYGQKYYSRKVCILNSCLYLVFITELVYLFAVIFSLSSFWTSLIISMFFLIFIREQMALTIYSNGIQYKGHFYHKNVIKEGMLVKNYRSEYELYLNKTKLIITSDELTLTKRMG